MLSSVSIIRIWLESLGSMHYFVRIRLEIKRIFYRTSIKKVPTNEFLSLLLNKNYFVTLSFDFFVRCFMYLNQIRGLLNILFLNGFLADNNRCIQTR